MNLYTESRYSESITRLALGIEAVDAASGQRMPDGVRVLLEQHPSPLHTWRQWPPRSRLDDALPAMRRHRSGRFSMLHDGTVPTTVTVRLVDDRRHIVPRRLRLDLPSLHDVVEGETDPTLTPPPLARRSVRVALHPGSNHPISRGATALRGRVVRPDPDGGAPIPVRWVRARANARTAAGELLGFAHGDDRGEFLLSITTPPGSVGFLDDPVEVRLHLSVADPAPVPDPTDPLRPELDPIWDLPIESIALPVDAATGRTFLPGHGSPAPIDLDLQVGATRSATFSIP